MLKPITVLFTLLVFGLNLPATMAADQTGTITVNITGLQSDKGDVRVNLYNSEAFLTRNEVILQTLTDKPSKGTASVSFTDLPYGTYAVAVHHDEDADGKMKTVYGTMPIEGLGVSNDAQGVMGPPKFKDAKFNLDAQTVTIEIAVVY